MKRLVLGLLLCSVTSIAGPTRIRFKVILNTPISPQEMSRFEPEPVEILFEAPEYFDMEVGAVSRELMKIHSGSDYVSQIFLRSFLVHYLSHPGDHAARMVFQKVTDFADHKEMAQVGDPGIAGGVAAVLAEAGAHAALSVGLDEEGLDFQEWVNGEHGKQFISTGGKTAFQSAAGMIQPVAAIQTLAKEGITLLFKSEFKEFYANWMNEPGAAIPENEYKAQPIILFLESIELLKLMKRLSSKDPFYTRILDEGRRLMAYRFGPASRMLVGTSLAPLGIATHVQAHAAILYFASTLPEVEIELRLAAESSRDYVSPGVHAEILETERTIRKNLESYERDWRPPSTGYGQWFYHFVLGVTQPEFLVHTQKALMVAAESFGEARPDDVPSHMISAGLEGLSEAVGATTLLINLGFERMTTVAQSVDQAGRLILEGCKDAFGGGD